MPNLINCPLLRYPQPSLPINRLNLQKIPNLIPRRQEILPLIPGVCGGGTSSPTWASVSPVENFVMG